MNPTTPYGYPPLTAQERHQCRCEAVHAAQDAAEQEARFVGHIAVSPRQDAIQAIIGHCLEARDEWKRTEKEQTLDRGGTNATAVVMAQAQYIGFVNGTLSAILAECRRMP